MHITAILPASVRESTALDPSKCEGRRVSPKQVLCKSNTQNLGLLQTSCQEAARFSPESSTFIFCYNSSTDLKKGENADKQWSGGTSPYPAIQSLNSCKSMVLPGILLMASSQRNYYTSVCLHISDFNCEPLEERNSIL